MARVLVTEEIAESGLEKLRNAGHEVDIQLGLTPAQLLEAVPGAHALIIRSATNVDAATLEAAIAPFRKAPYKWEQIPSGLEDVFIHLMDKSKDNFAS